MSGRSKAKDGRILTEDDKKIMIVKKQKKSLSSYFIISSITYVFTLIESLMMSFIFFIYYLSNSSYLGYLLKNLTLLVVCIISIVYALRKIRQQLRMQDDELIHRQFFNPEFISRKVSSHAEEDERNLRPPKPQGVKDEGSDESKRGAN